MKTKLVVSGIECHSYHGCLKEEAIIEGRFTVDVRIESDFTAAVQNDDLGETADYVFIHQKVREEMKVPSQLIEHVAGRILKQMHLQYPSANNIEVAVRKYNPPVNGQIESATFTVSLH